jgi:2-keto-4-pentenoate hydratase
VATSLTPAAAARVLFDQPARGERFAPLDGIADRDAAYAIQRELVRLGVAGGSVRAGYKIGLTSERMQAMCNIDSPIAGVIFAERIVPTGAELAAARYGRLALEFEIGLVLGADLPLRASPYAPAELAGAVAAVCPAMEIVDDRHASYEALDVLSLIADNSWNAGAVCGPRASTFPDLASLEGTVRRDGEVLDRGSGRDVLGHPLNVLAWLANHLNAGGDELRAGDLVMTGNVVTTKFVVPGEHYAFELDGLGSVEVRVVA